METVEILLSTMEFLPQTPINSLQILLKIRLQKLLVLELLEKHIRKSILKNILQMLLRKQSQGLVLTKFLTSSGRKAESSQCDQRPKTLNSNILAEMLPVLVLMTLKPVSITAERTSTQSLGLRMSQPLIKPKEVDSDF